MPAGHDADGEVEADDRVHRDDQRRGQAGEQQVGRLVAVPVPRRAAPAHRQHAVDDARRRGSASGRAASPGRGSGRRTRTAARPWRRSTPRTRPTSAGCGTAATCPSCSGRGTASRRATAGPRWSSGNSPAQATANSVIASAKRLIEVRHSWRKQQQDRRDQRAGVADADPPDEVDDGEAPGDRDVDAPDADALDEQVGERRRAAACRPAKPMAKPMHQPSGVRARRGRSS